MKAAVHSNEVVTNTFQSNAADYAQSAYFDRNILLKFFDSIEVYIADKIDVQLYRDLYSALYRIPDKKDASWIELLDDAMIVVSTAVANKISTSQNASELFKITRILMR
jgi:hypothetical protein